MKNSDIKPIVSLILAIVSAFLIFGGLMPLIDCVRRGETCYSAWIMVLMGVGLIAITYTTVQKQ